MNQTNKSIKAKINKFSYLYPGLIIFIASFLYAFYIVKNPNIFYLLMYFTPYITFIYGVKIIKTSYIEANISDENKYILLIKIFLSISLIALFAQWSALVKHYGSFEYIFAYAFVIREELIGSSGQDIFPRWGGYAFSLIYISYSMIMALWIKGIRLPKLLTILHIITIAGFDLSTFGRVGTIYSILIFLTATYLKFEISILFKIRSVIIICGLLFLAVIARLIRGDFDNFEASMDLEQRIPGLIPSSLNSIIVLIKYYSQSVFAFCEMIENYTGDHVFGQRNFLPIVNLIGKLYGASYQSRIDTPVLIPFEANIYSVAWDFYLDFGVIGVAIMGFLWGVLTHHLLSKQRSIYSFAAGIMLLGGYMFWPIYNIFSFGAPFIALTITILIYQVEKYFKK